MKYPKEWIEAANARGVYNGDYTAVETGDAVLDRLNKVGALKDPPKPREWWVMLMDCEVDRAFTEKDRAEGYNRTLDLNGKRENRIVHVREVLEDD